MMHGVNFVVRRLAFSVGFGFACIITLAGTDAMAAAAGHHVQDAAPQAVVPQTAAPDLRPAQDIDAWKKEFDTGIERLKQGDATVDVRRLRMLATELPGYRPDARGASATAMIEAIQRGEMQQVLDLALTDLGVDYLDIDAHLVAVVASQALGDAPAAAHHEFVVRRILESMTSAGDGSTPAQAFSVITIREQDALLRVLGLQVTSQTDEDADKHFFDVLVVLDRKTNAERRVYFNIDPIVKYRRARAASPPADGRAADGQTLDGLTVQSGTTGATGAPEVVAGRVLVRRPAQYPNEARSQRLADDVIVEVDVDETGNVTGARVLKGLLVFRPAAIAAARQWVFEPTLLLGTPVKVRGTITFRFRASM